MTLTTNEMHAWTKLYMVSTRLLSTIEADLKRASLPPLVWHDALMALQNAGTDGLRQFELGDELQLAQYSLSRLCDRLEVAGYVSKEPCPQDSRGLTLVITPAGTDLLEEMQPIYQEAIQTHFAKHLSGPEIVSLGHLLDRFPKSTPAI